MKKKSIIILLLLTVLLIGGGFMIWKLSSNKEKVNSSSSQQKKNLPLNELSDQELEKCLLEDFSRRLDLQKYFVFSLGELKTKKEEKVLHPNHGIVSNAYVVRQGLSKSLTQLGRYFVQNKKPETVGNLTNYSKNQVYFLNEIPGGHSPNEWSGEKGDKMIKENPHFYIIFEKNSNEEYYLSDYFENNEYKGKVYTNALNLKNGSFNIYKSKSEALEVIKTDPALSD